MARKKIPPPGPLERLQRVLQTRPGRMLLRVGVASLVFLGAGLVVRQARAQAYQLEGYRISPATIRFAALPRWADVKIQRLLSPAGITRYAGDFSVSVYDPDAHGVLVERLERHPFVRRVREVRVVYPNEAVVDVVLRVPVAKVKFQVRQGGKKATATALLSDDGCLLAPRAYATYLRGLRRPLPRAVGIRTRPPLRLRGGTWRLAVGVPWDDKDDRVAESLAAAELADRIFRDFRGRVVVQEIDVSRFHPDGRHRDQYSEVRLKALCPPDARGGSRVLRTIEWGRTEKAGRPVVGEDTTETKLQRLHAQLTRSPVPRPIDVRWWDAGIAHR